MMRRTALSPTAALPSAGRRAVTVPPAAPPALGNAPPAGVTPATRFVHVGIVQGGIGC